jgi:ABC-2 type transport system permease protein
VSRPAAAWRTELALVANELRLLARRPENLLVAIVVPVAVLAFLAVAPAFGTIAGPGSRLPGVLGLAIVATAFVNLGIATAYERGYGVLKRLGAAPVTSGQVVSAKLAVVLLVSAVVDALLIGVAAGIGWRPPSGGPDVLLLGTALALGSVAFAALGLALAGSLRPEAVLALANGLFVVFALFGGLIVPAIELPGALATAALALPSSALAEALRAGLEGSPAAATAPLLVLGAWAVVASIVAARTFRWD